MTCVKAWCKTFKHGAAFMADDVLLNKAASIERCIARARKEYNADPAGFASKVKSRQTT
jgi:hypothetical protein